MRSFMFTFGYYAPYPIEKKIRVDASTLPAAMGRAGRLLRKELGRTRTPKDLNIRVTSA